MSAEQSDHQHDVDGVDHDGMRATSTATETVRLELPLHHRHASTVRVVAASLAADIGFSVDEIEDLRLGVDEAVSVMADADAGPDARLHLRFDLAGNGLTVAVSRSGVSTLITRDDVDELAVRILRAVMDRFDVTDRGEFVVSKHTAPHGD
jgi:serine/threonine-protein kinase RsbW